MARLVQETMKPIHNHQSNLAATTEWKNKISDIDMICLVPLFKNKTSHKNQLIFNKII